jgi:hypothetical protein
MIYVRLFCSYAPVVTFDFPPNTRPYFASTPAPLNNDTYLLPPNNTSVPVQAQSIDSVASSTRPLAIPSQQPPDIAVYTPVYVPTSTPRHDAIYAPSPSPDPSVPYAAPLSSLATNTAALSSLTTNAYSPVIITNAPTLPPPLYPSPVTSGYDVTPPPLYPSPVTSGYDVTPPPLYPSPVTSGYDVTPPPPSIPVVTLPAGNTTTFTPPTGGYDVTRQQSTPAVNPSPSTVPVVTPTGSTVLTTPSTAVPSLKTTTFTSVTPTPTYTRTNTTRVPQSTVSLRSTTITGGVVVNRVRGA